MNRVGYFSGIVFGLIILIGLPICIYYMLRMTWHALNVTNPNLAIALITGATTIIASTTAVMIGRYYERKRDIEAHFRTTKIAMYEEFIEEFMSVFDGSEKSAGNSDKDLASFIRVWQRKMLLKAGSKVLKSYFEWMTKVKTNPDSAETFFAMDNFFRELRKDVGQSSSGLEKGAFTHLILKNASIFLTLAKKNPNITLTELADIEHTLGLS